MSSSLKRFSVSLTILAGLLGATISRPAAAQDASQGIPVTTSAARAEDVPVYLYGLGTVQPLNTVQVKAQVNGTLISLPIKEGQEVKQGDVIAAIDPRPYKAALDQAMAQREADKAQLASAQLDLKRYQDLAKKAFAPVQQVDDQQATVNKLIAQIAVDTALVETAQINLNYCVIRAPFDGRASFYQVTVGNVIQAANQSGGIITLVEDRPIGVVLTLPAANLWQVQQARARGPVPVMAYDGTSGQLLSTGTVLTPNNTIDTSTGTIALKAVFANQDSHLWPGQFVNTRVQVDTLQHAVTVPQLAVQHGPNGPFIYVVKPDNTVQTESIQVGDTVDDRTVVAKGLSGNETVVVTGQSRLAPGSHIVSTNSTSTNNSSGTNNASKASAS